MSLAKRANGALLTKLCAAALTYGFTLVMARWMAPAEFGQVAFFMNAAFLAAVLGAGGQHIALLRFLPGLAQSGQRREFHATLAAARKRAATVTALVFLGFLACAFVLRWFNGLEGFSPIVVITGALMIPAIGLVDFQAHVARSLNLIQLSLWPKEILWRGLALGMLLIVSIIAASPNPDAQTVTLVLSFALVLLALATHVKLRKALPQKPPDAGAPHTEWQETARPFWVSSVANIFLANADVIAVGIILGAAETGGYFLANRLAMLLAFFVIAHNVVLGPVISANWAAHQTDKIADIGRRAAMRMSIPTIALAAILVFLATPIMALFGPGYENGAKVLWLLAGAGVLNALGGPSDIVMNLCGQQVLAMRIAAATLVISAILIVAMGLGMGTLGVGLAILIATAFRKILFGVGLAKSLSMRVDAFASRSSARHAAGLRV